MPVSLNRDLEPPRTPEFQEGWHVDAKFIGCSVASILLLMILATIAYQGRCGRPPEPTDFYTTQERASLDSWLAKHESETPWIDAVRSNVVGKRAYFFKLDSEYRVYRIRGLTLKQCMDKVEPILKKNGLEEFDPYGYIREGRSTEYEFFSANYETADFDKKVELKYDENSKDILLVCEGKTGDFEFPKEFAKIKSELGFDPMRSVRTIDFTVIGPPK